MRTERDPQTLAQTEPAFIVRASLPRRPVRLDQPARTGVEVIISVAGGVGPVVVIDLPLDYVALPFASRFDLARGGFKLTFIGLTNYRKLLFGSERTHFLGLFAPSGPLHWLIFGLVVVALAVFLGRYLRSGAISFGGLLGRVLLVAGLGALAWMVIHTFGPGGRLGTLSVTLVFVFVGIFFQYTLGLGLALLTVQHLPGRRFFRVVFLLPMMITPVGVAYMFRMVTDTE